MLAGLLIVLLVLAPFPSFGAKTKGMAITGIRHATTTTSSRVVFELDGVGGYSLVRAQDGKSYTLSAAEGGVRTKTPLPEIRDKLIVGIERLERSGNGMLLIRCSMSTKARHFVLHSPERIVVDITKDDAAPPIQPVAATQSQATASAAGRSLLVVLDPGHGGQDAGIETGGQREKDLGLALALAIRKQFRGSPKVKILLTRESDQSLSLADRAALANSASAGVFISLHGTVGAQARVMIDEKSAAAADLASTATVSSAGTTTTVASAPATTMHTQWGDQQTSHREQSARLGRALARQLAKASGAEPLRLPLAGLRPVDSAAVLIEVGGDRDRGQTVDAIARGVLQYAEERAAQ